MGVEERKYELCVGDVAQLEFNALEGQRSLLPLLNLSLTSNVRKEKSRLLGTARPRQRDLEESRALRGGGGGEGEKRKGRRGGN